MTYRQWHRQNTLTGESQCTDTGRRQDGKHQFNGSSDLLLWKLRFKTQACIDLKFRWSRTSLVPNTRITEQKKDHPHERRKKSIQLQVEGPVTIAGCTHMIDSREKLSCNSLPSRVSCKGLCSLTQPGICIFTIRCPHVRNWNLQKA